jgi:Zn-finger nucleic acid-binding protein
VNGALCPSCGAALPAAFPGASVVCACGQRVHHPAARASAPPSLGGRRGSQGPRPLEGPYRSGGGAHEAPVLAAPCPYCGNECPPLVRICPHCDVRLDNVRCQRCFSLQSPGAFSCHRCAAPLDLEPLLDATDAPCPRCQHPLEAAPGDDARMHECPRCGGMFVRREHLAELLSRAELGGGFRESQPRVAALDPVRYVPCPLCHASMNRVNFGRVSGVIVDVCKMHGTWFDAGELTRVIAFAASGGLDKTRARELDDQRDERQRATEAHAQLAALDLRVEPRPRGRADDWDELLRALFFW